MSAVLIAASAVWIVVELVLSWAMRGTVARGLAKGGPRTFVILDAYACAWLDGLDWKVS